MDRVEASGGYMIASVADKITASPFKIIGSIGVVKKLPDIYRLLSNIGVDIELHAVRKHKRTLTMLGKNTQDGREKFKSELENILLYSKSTLIPNNSQLILKYQQGNTGSAK